MRSKRWIVILIILGCQTSLFSQDGFTLQEARDIFERSLQQHNDRQYEDAIQGFKKIFERFPSIDPGPVSAYNIACGYALLGKKVESLDWLAKAIDAGYRDPSPIERDRDLESIRGEEGYRKLIGDLQAIHAEYDVDRNGRKDLGDAAIHLEKGLERFITTCLDPKETANFIGKLESATVMVLVGSGGGGTGVLVKTKKGPCVVTAGHVATAGAQRIRLNDGREFAIDIVKQEHTESFDIYRLNGESASDLAVCRIRGKTPDDMPSVALAKGVDKGDRLFLLGYPGFYGRKTGGAVGNLGNAFRGDRQLTALTNVGSLVMPAGKFFLFSPVDRMRVPPLVGNSGGPLFNKRGELVGIAVTTNARMDVAIGGCVGLATIKSFLTDIEQKE